MGSATNRERRSSRRRQATERNFFDKSVARALQLTAGKLAERVEDGAVFVFEADRHAKGVR